MLRTASLLGLCLLAATHSVRAQSESTFVNWESAHVHPLDITPDRSTLLAVNTADARLEVFDLDAAGTPTWRGSIRVGLDPVTVRTLTNDVAWVVNQISDTISEVDVTNLKLTRTIATPDEPCDVVFTGTGGAANFGSAWVSCGQPAVLARFDLANLANAPTLLSIHGKDPTALAVSPDESKIYVALKSSGNRTTVIAGGQGALPDAVRSTASPYATGGNPGPNPPPNTIGGQFDPPLNPALPLPLPGAAMIVRKDGAGQWRDDLGKDWTPVVSGANAADSGRIQGWDLADHDIAIVDTANPSPSTTTFASNCMNIVAGIAVQPLTGGHAISVVGTEAINEVRFEPNLKGIFVRSVGAAVDPVTGVPAGVIDLNPQLDYSTFNVGQTTRDEAVGDPRALVFDSTGSHVWVAGMGSNNVARIDLAFPNIGARIATTDVGAGPTGLVIDELRSRVFVLNKFDATVSVINITTNAVVATRAFHDPTPLAIARGRKHLYDTHRTSGLGQVSCASCHIDARMDGLAWDLGNPAGDLKNVHGFNLDYNLTPYVPVAVGEFHPMKGPMVTQTLQDIIGKEPHHWRGDRRGIEEFNGAFEGLMGDDAQLSAAEMQEFEDFLASIFMPPNPFRLKSNALNTSLDLTRFGLKDHKVSPAVPLTTGNAARGLDLFTPVAGIKQDSVHCVRCHTNPVGIGPDHGWWTPPPSQSDVQPEWRKMAAGEFAGIHSMIITTEPQSDTIFRPMKIAGLRNMHEKIGFDLSSTESLAGFGYLHDGTFDTLGRFLSQAVFGHPNSTADISDLSALMLSYSGTRMPDGDKLDVDFPPGVPGQNTNAGVGFQWTVRAPVTQTDLDITSAMIATHDGAVSGGFDDIALVATQNRPAGGQDGFRYAGGYLFDTDQAGTQTDIFTMLGNVQAGTELTLTLVPFTERTRLGVDRDGDGRFDGDEANAGTDPADRLSITALGTPCNATLPAVPSNVAPVAAQAYRVSITWNDNSSNESGFVVERAWANSLQWETVGVTAANVNNFDDDSVGTDTDYVYRVRAFNCAGRSAPSATSASVLSLPVPTTVDCHVSAIDFQFDAPGVLLLWGTVTVVDDQGRLVKDADVQINLSGGLTTTPPVETTDEQGQAEFRINISAATSLTFTVTVQSITGTNITYNAAMDFVTSVTVSP